MAPMKPLCLIYANCQGTGIERILRLSPLFRRRFDTRIVSNWSETTFPMDLLETCRLFLYQPTKARPGVPSTEDLARALPPQAEAVSFPYMYTKAFWPFHRRSSCTDVGKTFPQERHYYADAVLDELAASPLPERRIVDMYMGLDFTGRHDIRDNLHQTFAHQKAKEVGLDIKCHDFIELLHAKRRLFLTVRHPTPYLYLLVGNRILQALHYPQANLSDLAGIDPIYHITYEHPIHPGIVAALGLTCVEASTRYALWDELFTYEAYVADYVRSRKLRQALETAVSCA